MQHRVVVGLGNPGKKYEMTRHNMGFLVLHALAQRWQWAFKDEKRFSALVAKGGQGDQTVHLVMPTTYMNNSGLAVRRYLDFFHVDVDALLVVTDDADLDFGIIRLRKQGGSGGHNGLKSIYKHLGTSQYPRLRVGIGREERMELEDYVLSAFTSQEQKVLAQVVSSAADVIERVLIEGIDSVTL